LYAIEVLNFDQSYLFTLGRTCWCVWAEERRRQHSKMASYRIRGGSISRLTVADNSSQEAGIKVVCMYDKIL